MIINLITFVWKQIAVFFKNTTILEDLIIGLLLIAIPFICKAIYQVFRKQVKKQLYRNKQLKRFSDNLLFLFANQNVTWGDFKKCVIRNVPITLIHPKQKQAKHRMTFSLRKNILLTGSAGAGKTTFLWNILINKKQFCYIRADEICRSDFEKNEENLFTHFLVDSADEVDIDQRTAVANKLKSMIYKGDIVILACRNEAVRSFALNNESITGLFDYIWELNPWSKNGSDNLALKLIGNYCRFFKKDNEYKERLLRACQDEIDYSDLYTTPLFIIILIYILDSEIESGDPHKRILSVTDLYNQFVNAALYRECIKKNVPQYNYKHSFDIAILAYEKIAFALLCDGNCQIEWVKLRNDTYRVRINDVEFEAPFLDLFCSIDTRTNIIHTFRHETIKEYFSAMHFVSRIREGNLDISLIKALSSDFKDQLALFVLSAINDYDNELRISMYDLLEQSYYLADKLPSGLEKTKIKDQILFLSSRIKVDDTKRKPFIEQVYKLEKNRDVFVARSAAISSAVLGIEYIHLEYVNSLLNDPIAELGHRSFTMAYFGDGDGDLFNYLDNGTDSWKNSREKRFVRMSQHNISSYSFRLLDIVTIYGFLKSRPNDKLTIEELNIVKAIQQETVHSDSIKQLISKIVGSILEQYNNCDS